MLLPKKTNPHQTLIMKMVPIMRALTMTTTTTTATEDAAPVFVWNCPHQFSLSEATPVFVPMLCNKSGNGNCATYQEVTLVFYGQELNNSHSKCR
jgi:hypothetical protein